MSETEKQSEKKEKKVSKKTPKIFGIYAELPKWLSIILGILPFVVLIALYLVASDIRLTESPQDKILPSISKMIDAVELTAFTPDKRTGEYLMLTDTLASLKRVGIGIGLAAIIGLFLGINLGLFPSFDTAFERLINFLSIIPPLALLPIVFISFGVDESGKIALIFIGTVFVITRDIRLATKNIPNEQKVKTLTLGASEMQLTYSVVLPQIIPRLIETIRLSLGPAWLFLIASEAIASENGLGYRIFLVRRYLAMDIIIPYVLWITFIGMIIDKFLLIILQWKYDWYLKKDS